MAPAFSWINYSDNSFTSGATTNIGSTAAVFANGSILAGDILIAGLIITGVSSQTITPPVGWTQLGGNLNSSNPDVTTFWYKIAGASETGSYTFSWVTSTAYAWVLEDFTGTGLLDGTPDASTVNTGGGGGFTTNNITTLKSPDVMTLIGFGGIGISYTNPADMTSRASGVLQISGSCALMASDRTLSVPGTYNETTVSGNFRNFSYVLVAMGPATTGTIIIGVCWTM